MFELRKDVKISLKVMMNKEKTKLLFAEADGKFAEILLSFLNLPLGEIVRVLKNHYGDKEPIVGSLNTLYTGLNNLDDVHFCTNGGKKMLLNPRNSSTNEPRMFFKCGDDYCENKSSPNVSIYYDSGICDCGKPLNRSMGAIQPKPQRADDGIFVEGLSFLVTNDLKLAPCEPGSVIRALVDLGIVITEGAEPQNVILGYNEIVDLLKGSLLSKTPLSDTIFRVSNKNTEYVLEDLLDEMEPEPEPSLGNSKRITVTAIIQKSTNKLIYVEAKEDFMDFIFSFLTIPLGGVESLLGSKTRFTSIDNLYNSAENFIKDRHLIKKDVKRRRLQEPELPPYYLSKNQIFPLAEQIIPPMYYCKSTTDSSGRTVEKGFWMTCKDPKGNQGCYVKEPGTFVINDDLSVEESVFISRALLCWMDIPPSDVKEMEVKIGLKEGLSILKASVASTSALTDGLINPLLKMQSR